jgi:DNA-binding NarL/FixJ family response regulator
MKAAVARKPLIRVAVVESDPLRFVGFRALFDTEPDLELVSASLADLGQLQAIDLVLLGNRGGQNLYDIMASMKAIRPDLRIIVTGSGMDDESVLKAIAAGAKGYVDEAASPAEFIQALRIVHQGSVWAPRRVLSTFIERVSASPGRIFPAGRITFTDREKEVLEMLVAGRSNKEIGSALGIEERTVKAHVAKLMRKVGVQNRIALSVHAITHSLVTANTTAVQASWAARYMAKRGSTAPLEDLTHFVKLLSAGTLVTLGISALSSDIPYSSTFAVAALAAGCYLGWSGFRWDHLDK